ncbi:MAG TPA: LptE family protein [Cytophagaceae bacterium]|nr:LptE family protein [Cytophagaceae bacterium]
MNIRFLLSISSIFLSLSSCGVYNFTGGQVPSDVKTISIQYIYNESGQGPPNLAQNMTEKLKTYYQSNTKLILVPSGADWKIEGKIVSYVSTGVSPTAQETSGSNRLTITAKISFTNTKDEKQNFESNFSFYQDYPAQKTLNSVESTLSGVILDQMVLDIYQKTTSTW